MKRFVLFVIRVVLLLIVMLYVLFMCKCVLPPGVNPIAVDRYINISNYVDKLYMFRTVPLSIIMIFSLYTQQWYMSYRFVDSSRAGSGWNILILLDSCLKTCMTCTIAECTVKNS
jgi:hypothetical protein